ncbi:MAG: hypothetical protein H0V01_15020 [Bacteroidetes bacterium]|nr:hypothetical protein [Bacteroidota bacterium]HET6243774.1 hypothetical protein [Bacteroidia bacterium]
MKKMALYYSLLIILIFNNSCRKDEVNICSKEYSSVEFENINLPQIPFTNAEYIIQDDSTYQEIFKSFNLDSAVVLPNIDFTQKTLLGQYLKPYPERKKNYKYIKKVCFHEIEKKYLYKISLVETNERAIFPISNWALIPKTPSNNLIEFKVKY